MRDKIDCVTRPDEVSLWKGLESWMKCWRTLLLQLLHDVFEFLGRLSYGDLQ